MGGMGVEGAERGGGWGIARGRGGSEMAGGRGVGVGCCGCYGGFKVC